MEELAGQEATLRQRPRWWLYGTIAMLLASAGLVVSFVLQRRSERNRAAAVAKILDIVDKGYTTCVLGGPVSDAELGTKLLEQEMTGVLTASKVKACGELAWDKLAPFEGVRHENRPRLDTFWDGSFYNSEEDDFGVCSHLELIRGAANDLGVAVPPPHCAVELAELEPVRSQIHEYTLLHHVGDDAVLDEEGDAGQHVALRTTTGKSWTTSDRIQSNQDLQVSTGGIWAYGDGHVAVLDGERWRPRAAYPKGSARVVSYRKTAAGWTMLWWMENDGALVWRLDPMMSKVLSTTAIPALNKRWTTDAKPLGTVAADGTATALLLRRTPDAVEIEADVAHPDGTVDAPRITRLPSRGTVIETDMCHALGATYLAIDGVGTVVTLDGGVTFTVLRGGDAVFPAASACSDQQLIAAGNGHLMICDQAECKSQVTPHRSGKTFSTRVAMHGESARILVTDENITALFRADPGGAVTFEKAWRWSGIDIPALVRAEDTWFFMQ
jgi:hypothetical protein